MPIGIALMGAGIFAQAQHLPAIEACDLLELKAVYSRSQATAEALVAKAKTTPTESIQTYFDEPATPGRGLADLLARTDVATVAICMPIAMQPDAIRAVLAAGKHVISEKPVAERVASAKALLAHYQALPQSSPPRPIWAVAENYRYQKSLQLAESQLRSLGGRLVSFHLSVAKIVREDGRYFHTPWRKVPTHPGGYLLDGGIHYVASLRALLGAAAAGSGVAEEQNKIVKVAGALAQLQPILPPADTLRAVAVTKGGASGVMSISFGQEFGPGLEVSVTTTEGWVTWRPNRVTVVRRGAKNDSPIEETFDCSASNPNYPQDEATGVKAEFAAFARSIASGNNTVDPRQSPEEAFQDLLLLEAMFDSGEAGLAAKEVA